MPLRITIPSDFVAGREAQKRILDEVIRAGFNSRDTFAIKLSLEEALVNAIKHGNRHDKKKMVHVSASITAKKCEISVEDEGLGFVRKCVPDPTADENIDKCSGRGILLMESYMDEVKWTKNGRRVKLVKNNVEGG